MTLLLRYDILAKVMRKLRTIASTKTHEGDEMEDKLRKTYLYDFYGEMLNEHQRAIYEDSVFNDLSLSEIAAEEGISRQGVSDMIRRCEKKLEDYESKLHLVGRFLKIKADIEEIYRLTDLDHSEERSADSSVMQQIREISNQILEEL